MIPDCRCNQEDCGECSARKQIESLDCSPILCESYGHKAGTKPEDCLGCATQSIVDLRAQLEACQKEKTAALAKLQSWEYEPSGQLRAKLSNAATQSILDLAKEYMDERDTLLALLRESHDVLSKFDGSPKTRQNWADLRTLAPKLQATLAAHKEPV